MSQYRYVMRVALTVAMGGFLMGFDASVISGVVKFIEPQFDLSKIELGLGRQLAHAHRHPGDDGLRAAQRPDRAPQGAVPGRDPVCRLGHRVGPRPDLRLLVIARMIGGLGVGASLIIAPMYIAEIAPPAVRGRMVSFNQLNIVVGISVAFFTNYLILQLGQSDAGWAQSLMFDEYNWRWMLGLETLPAVLYFFGLFFVPESPRWLLLKGREEEARKILTHAVGEAEAREELDEIHASLAKDAGKEKVSVMELFAPAMRLVLTIGIVVAIIQQITGINSVFFYAPMIFEQSGIGTDASFAQAVLVGLINLVFTIVAIAVHRPDRPQAAAHPSDCPASPCPCSFWRSASPRPTYTITGDALANLPAEVNVPAVADLQDTTFESDVEFKQALRGALGDELATQYESDLINAAIAMNPWLVLFGVLGFVASFAVSIGPVMWVLFSELFPNRIRGIAISFVGLINSAVSFGVQLVFPWELANFGSATTFLIYGLFAAVGLVFVLLVLPETKGRSLEELETLLVKNPA